MGIALCVRQNSQIQTESKFFKNLCFFSSETFGSSWSFLYSGLEYNLLCDVNIPSQFVHEMIWPVTACSSHFAWSSNLTENCWLLTSWSYSSSSDKLFLLFRFLDAAPFPILGLVRTLLGTCWIKHLRAVCFVLAIFFRFIIRGESFVINISFVWWYLIIYVKTYHKNVFFLYKKVT